MRAESCALTDVGRKREHNEDAYHVNDDLGLYVVCDGMGGHAAGEVASAEAVDAVCGMVARGRGAIDAYRQRQAEETTFALRRLLESGIQAATYMVYGLAQMNPESKGMGTTISSLLVVDHLGVVGQVGDSRVYLVRGGRVVQVTEDHTLVQMQLKAGLITAEQAKHSPKGNVITRAVGPRDYVQVDTFLVPLQTGDRLLLCSDGLHGYLETPEIPEVMGDDGLQPAAQRFIDLANDRGGKDNITAIIVRIP